ncbi:hypothetical protein CAEBREN_13053 [Caenorhabditis brenneri]|uniref:BRK domain-containing protein n=1 Tax=Caenorhabditis brenneri TaxID=135651 RepID=G0NPE3_CAEBE|nr:hypothetical protein CAEBREN_13053 [Caenorhabditis brenneri]
MKLLSIIVSAITEYIETGAKKFEMDTTTHPFTKLPDFPKVVKNSHGFQILESPKGGKKIGLTLAADSFDGVHPKSLIFIQDMLTAFFENHIGIREVLDFPLPKHTVAVGFAMQGFEVGDGTGKFYPSDGNQGFTTYQKISANLQAVYFTSHRNQEISFLSGILYFPALKGRAKCFLNDRAAVHHVIGSREPYPLQDREKSHQKVNHKSYGRFCSIARKRVLVDCSGKYVRHLEYDHFWNTWKRTVCEECLVDSVLYKWEDPLTSQIASRIQQADDTIAVFNRDTGCVLEESPKVKDLKEFLEVNPDVNVAPEAALLAKILLGDGYEGRIGGKINEHPLAEMSSHKDIPTSSTSPSCSTSDNNFSHPLEQNSSSDDEDYSKLETEEDDEFEDATEDFEPSSSGEDSDIVIVN